MQKICLEINTDTWNDKSLLRKGENKKTYLHYKHILHKETGRIHEKLFINHGVGTG